MTSRPYDPNLTEWLQLSGETIALKAAGERISWIVFLLEELQAQLPKPAYASLLAGLQKEIAHQLELGRG